MADEVDAAFKALHELFTSKEARSHAHRRCPIDGLSDFDVAWESAMEEHFGPDLEYQACVHWLRGEGLIFW